jgi:hypothetical protein
MLCVSASGEGFPPFPASRCRSRDEDDRRLQTTSLPVPADADCARMQEALHVHAPYVHSATLLATLRNFRFRTWTWPTTQRMNSCGNVSGCAVCLMRWLVICENGDRYQKEQASEHGRSPWRAAVCGWEFDTLTWLELQLISNSSSTSNLTLDLEVLDGMVRMTLNVLFQSLDVWVEGERKVFCFYPTWTISNKHLLSGIVFGCVRCKLTQSYPNIWIWKSLRHPLTYEG